MGKSMFLGSAMPTILERCGAQTFPKILGPPTCTVRETATKFSWWSN